MNRRAFIGGLLASAAVRTWPFRVFSFPKEIARPVVMPPIVYYDRMAIQMLPEQPFITVATLRTMKGQLLRHNLVPSKQYFEYYMHPALEADLRRIFVPVS